MRDVVILFDLFPSRGFETWSTNIEIAICVDERVRDWADNVVELQTKLTYQLWLSCVSIHTSLVFKLWNRRRGDKHISFSSDQIKPSPLLTPHAPINLMSGYYSTQSMSADRCEEIAKERRNTLKQQFIWFLYANIYAPSATVNSKATQPRLALCVDERSSSFGTRINTLPMETSGMPYLNLRDDPFVFSPTAFPSSASRFPYIQIERSVIIIIEPVPFKTQSLLC